MTNKYSDWLNGWYWLIALFVVLYLALPEQVLAEDIGRVRTKLESTSPVWVGQKVDITVELLSPTIFSGAADFAIPSVPGLIIMKAGGSPTVSSATIDGDTWSVQRHSLFAYAHRAEEFQIPAFQVKFAVPPKFGQPPIEQRLTTQPLVFEAKFPPEAEGLSLLISTSNLEVDESWQPSIPDKGTIELAVGDAITRTIRLVADDVPGMALPPIVLPEPEGLSAYPNNPIVNDKEDRGSLRGSRTESTTYVCEVPGKYSLPIVSIPWLNTKSNELEKIRLDSVSINVVASKNEVVEDRETTTAQDSESNRSFLGWLLGGLVVLIGGGLIWTNREAIRGYFETEQMRARREESELFRNVLRACESESPARVYDAMVKWLGTRLEGSQVATLQRFSDEQQSEDLTRQLEILQRCLVDSTRKWSGAELASELVKANRKQRMPWFSWNDEPLTPLNPSK